MTQSSKARSFLFAAVKAKEKTIKWPTLSQSQFQYAFSLKIVIHWSMVNLPEHKRPSPANPSLQVQLCPPTVLVQFAFTSQLWLPVLHSSISTTEIILWTQYVYKSRLAWGLQLSVPPLTLVSQQIYVNTSGHLQQILSAMQQSTGRT